MKSRFSYAPADLLAAPKGQSKSCRFDSCIRELLSDERARNPIVPTEYLAHLTEIVRDTRVSKGCECACVVPKCKLRPRLFVESPEELREGCFESFGRG